MRILIATDAWRPQVNGVAHTYERLGEAIGELGAELDFVTPGEFWTLPYPAYPEIRLSLIGPRRMARRIEQAAPDFIHIATEGPIGIMARAFCKARGQPFTTSYHTRFPEYIAARYPLREDWIYALQRRFHNSGNGVMVATQTLQRELEGRGFRNLMPWSRGVDTTLFRPRDAGAQRREPVFLYVGRVSVEKNIEAFLKLDLPGSKMVVGDGPQLAALRSRYPQAIFAGMKRGAELARCYADADVFVFPSLTDTYGIVLLEALASGLPVAAYPVMGPADIVRPDVGVLDADLGRAALGALDIDRRACREFALKFSWRGCARQFLDNVLRVNDEQPIPAWH